VTDNEKAVNRANGHYKPGKSCENMSWKKILVIGVIVMSVVLFIYIIYKKIKLKNAVQQYKTAQTTHG
jgi:hypothetical protein